MTINLTKLDIKNDLFLKFFNYPVIIDEGKIEEIRINV